MDLVWTWCGKKVEIKGKDKGEVEKRLAFRLLGLVVSFYQNLLAFNGRHLALNIVTAYQPIVNNDQS